MIHLESLNFTVKLVGIVQYLNHRIVVAEMKYYSTFYVEETGS